MLGEISRNDVGILRKSTLILIMKNKTEEMTSYSSGSYIDFNNKKTEGMLKQISRNCLGIPLEVNTDFDNEK